MPREFTKYFTASKEEADVVREWAQGYFSGKAVLVSQPEPELERSWCLMVVAPKGSNIPAHEENGTGWFVNGILHGMRRRG